MGLPLKPSSCSFIRDPNRARAAPHRIFKLHVIGNSIYLTSPKPETQTGKSACTECRLLQYVEALVCFESLIGSEREEQNRISSQQIRLDRIYERINILAEHLTSSAADILTTERSTPRVSSLVFFVFFFVFSFSFFLLLLSDKKDCYEKDSDRLFSLLEDLFYLGFFR